MKIFERRPFFVRISSVWLKVFKMNVYQTSEFDMDQRLRLDKRQDARGFCRNFASEPELPAGSDDLQETIRNELADAFFANFDDGINRAKLPSWRRMASALFFFPSEMIEAERIVIEISSEILGDKLLGLIRSCLEKHGGGYCVMLAVFYGEQKASNYIGRGVINLDEIAVESSLWAIWCKKVPSLELAARA
jgi:hypothetical protein